MSTVRPSPCHPSWWWFRVRWDISGSEFLFYSEPRLQRSCPSAPYPPSLPERQTGQRDRWVRETDGSERQTGQREVERSSHHHQVKRGWSPLSNWYLNLELISRLINKETNGSCVAAWTFHCQVDCFCWLLFRSLIRSDYLQVNQINNYNINNQFCEWKPGQSSWFWRDLHERDQSSVRVWWCTSIFS